MPTYEYMCEKCEHEFEREQRISDPPVKTCPKCRSRKVTKLISRTSFVLKGGGWYSDLYSSTGGGSKSESDSDSSSSSSSDSSSSSTSNKDDSKKSKSTNGSKGSKGKSSKKSAA